MIDVRTLKGISGGLVRWEKGRSNEFQTEIAL